ncbi:MAG: peptidoglycan-binding protein, partial [Actinomycetota bacterium]|nr:peptidoglycan-binding protein [Actinomycetota bacterium]
APQRTPEPAALLAPGDSGPRVRELQSRLDQIAWYAPDVTGEYDAVTVAAVRGFQRKRGLDATGEVDEATWRRLLGMTRRPTYPEMHNILTPGPSLIGPGDSGVDVRELQARLQQIGWFDAKVSGFYGDVTAAAVAGFQTKRQIPSTGEVDQRTWNRLAAMTTTPSRAQMFDRRPDRRPDRPADRRAARPDEPSGAPAPVPLDPRCLTGEVLCIDKSTKALRWVVDGTVQVSFDVRFGSELTPTREGQFAVTWKSRDHVSSLYDTPMPFAMFFSGGQAVHYSPDFAANGYNGASHGCVNVRHYAGIAALFDQVDVGDRVVVYWS